MTRLRQQGMTLIEMMVAMLIGSILVVAVMLVLGGALNRPSAEGSRRSLGSGADLDQSAAIAMFQIDKWVRSAGTGLVQTVNSPYTYSYAYGCQLFAAKGGTQMLPFTGTFPKPFDGSAFLPSSTAGVFRLLPVLIIPGATTPNMTNMTNPVPANTSDALVLMASGNGYGEVPIQLSSAATSGSLPVPNTTAFSGAGANDLALVADSQPDATTGGAANCMVTQVALTTTDGSATTIPLGGSWAVNTIGTQSITNYSSSSFVLDLGDSSAASTQPPSFLAVGVGDNDTLYVYDLLGVRTPQLQARGQNVFELHALYGVDTAGDGKVHSWVSASSGSYTVSALTAGSIAASNLIKTIKAVRVGLILRTDLPEKSTIATSPTLTLFSDLGTGNTTTANQFTRTLTGAELYYRYRTVEATIPVRNNSF